MNERWITVNIEGDFIDSFIYSGTLFLVGADSKITTHNWESLIASAVLPGQQKKEGLAAYTVLTDCRQKVSKNECAPLNIYITKNQLNDEYVSSLQLEGWPTDINIYANRFYIASEDGVEEFPFEWNSRRLNVNGRFHVWKKYAYKVSANDGHRLAIAAGINGVIAAFPRGGKIREDEDISTLLEIDSHDCEWVGRNLVSNSAEGPFLSTFSKLPKKQDDDISDDYWKFYNQQKRKPPQTKRLTNQSNCISYAWVAGNKLFSLSDTGALTVEPATENDDQTAEPAPQSITPTGIDIGNEILEPRKILSARSGLFGTVIETANFLCAISETGIEQIADRPVSWRVFPRAKNYLNHLHVVKNDHLCIRAYFPYGLDRDSDQFGIGVAEVI